MNDFGFICADVSTMSGYKRNAASYNQRCLYGYKLTATWALMKNCQLANSFWRPMVSWQWTEEGWQPNAWSLCFSLWAEQWRSSHGMLLVMFWLVEAAQMVGTQDHPLPGLKCSFGFLWEQPQWLCYLGVIFGCFCTTGNKHWWKTVS